MKDLNLRKVRKKTIWGWGNSSLRPELTLLTSMLTNEIEILVLGGQAGQSLGLAGETVQLNW